MKRGPKPIDDEPKTEIVRIRVTSGQRLELRRVADENGTTISAVIRESVDEYCADCRDDLVFRRHKRRTGP